ncbi:MAG: hypothetical protein RL662_162 [Bacteroidota bacterium]|jgi:DNA-binding transcriptional LysR family regulator
MVNLEWYRTFKAIYQNGTLTRAAEELSVSQPNVSIQLASLETYIGHPLFIRLPRKMEPTEYGKRLYTQVIEAIDALEKVEAEFKKNILAKAPTIRLGTPSEIFQNYMVTQLKHLQSDIVVIYGMADGLIDQLAKNELDIAIITKQNNLHANLSYEPLFTETFMIVGNPQFDTQEFDVLVKEQNIVDAEKWLKKKTWYAYSSNLALIRRFWRENFKKRPVLKLKAVIPDNNALLEALINEDTLTVTSDIISHKILEEGRVKVIWKGLVPATNTLHLVYNKSKIQAKQVDEIRAFIKISISDALNL